MVAFTLPTKALDPDYAENFQFPLKDSDCFWVGDRTKLTSWFYMRRNDMGGLIYGALNIPAKKGSKVYSICSGEVTQTSYDYINGIKIEVTNSKGLTVKYCHLSKWYVIEGFMVNKGQVLGMVGRTGRTTGINLRLIAEYRGDQVCISPYFNRKWYCIEGDVNDAIIQ